MPSAGKGVDYVYIKEDKSFSDVHRRTEINSNGDNRKICVLSTDLMALHILAYFILKLSLLYR